MAVPALIVMQMARSSRGYGGGGAYGGSSGNDNDLAIFAALAAMLVVGVIVIIMLAIFIPGPHKDFKDYPGDIYAGHPVTVESVMWDGTFSTKYTSSGYEFFLVSSDEGQTKRHRVNAETFYTVRDGEEFTWKDGTHAKALKHLYDYDRPYYEKVYDLALKVKQCLPQNRCVTDTVEVNFKTWFYAKPGDTLTFAGEPGKVVS